ncbi:MAG: sugar ABC transporter permease [Actinobacteria bacterium]|nr:sugar ABC transporter permease [Actinomycetota bacterium]
MSRAAQLNKKSSQLRARIQKNATPYLFLAPGVLLFLTAVIYPTLQALKMSFYDWKIVSGAISQFIGFENYIRAFRDSHFWLSLSKGIWKGVGWAMMIFLAALQGVPKELEEAADVDGANRWQRFKAVTLPAIAPATTFVAIMLVIGGFNVFISVQLMTDGGPIGQTDVLLTYMYRQAFSFLDFGYGSALSAILSLVVFAFALIQLRLFRSRSGEDI